MGVASRRGPAGQLGWLLFVTDLSSLPSTCALPAHRLALVTPWTWVFCDYHPKPTPRGILEEDETSPFASGLVCFSMGPGPVVLWAAGLALALLAAGLCPCQERASKPGTGRSGDAGKSKAPLPCLLPVPALACRHSCLAGSFPRHQDSQSFLSGQLAWP